MADEMPIDRPLRVSETPDDNLNYTPHLVRFLMPRRGTSSTFSGLFALILLAFVPASASADDFFADLDRDGVRDIVTIPKAPARGLLVWLSGSKSLLRLPTRRPIMGVAARDVDGDGGIDLVAADTSAKLHVWHRTSHGRLRTTHPRRSPPSAGPAHSRTLDQSSDPDTPAIGSDAAPDLTCDAVHPSALRLDTAGLANSPADRPAGWHDGPPHDPRGPPSLY